MVEIHHDVSRFKEMNEEFTCDYSSNEDWKEYSIAVSSYYVDLPIPTLTISVYGPSIHEKGDASLPSLASQLMVQIESKHILLDASSCGCSCVAARR